MFLKIFLASVALLVVSLIGEAIVFFSVWRNSDDQDEVFKRMPFFMLLGIGGTLGVLGMIVSVVLKYFGYVD
jgi:F0F1-type ATP synthase membrane subunit c/vacuolar-type H+-ATPase subunit K